MQRKFIVPIFVIYIVLFSILSFSANIDEALFKADKQHLIAKYEKLLSGLKDKNDSVSSARKAILYSLINIVKFSKEQKFELEPRTVRNQYDFLKILESFARYKIKYNQMKNQINKIDKKLNSLGRTIAATDINDKDLLLYQLQYAFYKITLKRLKQDRERLKGMFSAWENDVYLFFVAVKFNKYDAEKKIESYLKTYEKMDDFIQKLNIESDRLSLLNREDKKSQIKKKIEETYHKKNLIVKKIIDGYMIIYLSCLKNKEDITKPDNNINIWKSRLNDNDLITLIDEEKSILYVIAKKRLGHARLMLNYIKNGYSNAVSVLWHFVKKPIFSIGDSYFSILNLIISLFVFFVGVLVGKLYKKKIMVSPISKNMSISTKTVLSNIGYYVILIIAFFSGLRIVGINLSSLAVVLGALSVGVGFGLQNIVANFISGITLMLENSVRIGDYIEISDELKGVVKDIKIRSTTLDTNDNVEIIIPNQTLFQSNVINWTLTERIKRFRIPFSVAYGSDVQKVIDVVISALDKSGINYIKNEPGKEPDIKMTEMNSSSVDFNLDIWVAGDDIIYPRKTTSKFLIVIYEALNENNISIPFPQMDIHVREPVKIQKDN